MTKEAVWLADLDLPAALVDHRDDFRLDIHDIGSHQKHFALLGATSAGLVGILVGLTHDLDETQRSV